MSSEVVPDTATGRAQELTPGARRILEVASELFYRRGITAVGVDTIATESGVTKRTLYNRFGSKDNLVAAYLRARDQRWRELVVERVGAASPGSPGRVLAPFDVLAGWLEPSSRGCGFVNAFAELPDPEHLGRRIVVEEKEWLRTLFRDLLAEAGADGTEVLATQLLSLHEGAIISFSIAGDTDAPVVARSAARSLVDEALPRRHQDVDPPGSPGGHDAVGEGYPAVEMLRSSRGRGSPE